MLISFTYFFVFLFFIYKYYIYFWKIIYKSVNKKNNTMNTKSFLVGYFYAAFQLYNQFKKENNPVDFWLSQIHVYTINGGKLIIGINRGICPIEGNVPYAFTDMHGSSFDVVKHWTTSEIWEYICTIHEDQGSEVRMYLDEIVSIIDYFGGLDLKKMETEVLNNK